VGVAAGAGAEGFSLEQPAASSTAAVQAENNLMAFMVAKFSTGAAKSHARNEIISGADHLPSKS
jgi:hypothetical protein